MKKTKTNKNKLFKVSAIISFILNGIIALILILGFALGSNNAKSDAKVLDNNIQYAIDKNYAIVPNNNYQFVSYDLTHIKEDFYNNLSNRVTLDMTYNVSIADFLVLSINGGPITEEDYSISLFINFQMFDDNTYYANIQFKHSSTFIFHYIYESNSEPVLTTFIGQVSFYNGIQGIGDIYTYFPLLFDEIDNYEFNLNNGFSPYALLGSSFTRPSSSVNPTWQVLTDSVWVGIGSKIYNQIRVMWSGNSVYVYHPDDDSLELLDNSEYIALVVAENTITHLQTILMTPQYIEKDGKTCAIYNSLAFSNRDNGYLSLLYGAERPSSLASYNNYQLFNSSFSGFVDYGTSGSGQFGDVFGLIGIAFTGLTGLLSIQILPNITLGVLFVLPIIAVIVFALIRVIKK